MPSPFLQESTAISLLHSWFTVSLIQNRDKALHTMTILWRDVQTEAECSEESKESLSDRSECHEESSQEGECEPLIREILPAEKQPPIQPRQNTVHMPLPGLYVWLVLVLLVCLSWITLLRLHSVLNRIESRDRGAEEILISLLRKGL